jgi:UDP:flavonoid glycosyltransferase YjiC (YdhE family)
MAAADLVICHGGHGTVARALDAGVPVLVSPAIGDMAENGARVAWSGTGLMVPHRLLSPRSIRTATRRLLGDDAYSGRAAEIAAWSREHDGATRAASLVEEAARNETSRLAPTRP